MAADDRYGQYYSERLWQLLPVAYRLIEGTSSEGPLREIVNRIGVQIAVVRRSIDRLWDDQSIETADDWLVPYIGDLLGTHLVAPIDARAQRIDVAKTIYYRRRKGTIGLLEELAADIAGREARVVELFRSLSRSRHAFDPRVGAAPRPSAADRVVAGSGASPPLALSLAPPLMPPPAEIVAGLAGRYTRTPSGGYGDLRHRYGASRCGTAFDEFAYTADFRRGRQSTGLRHVPRLGAFVWWLSSWQVPASTPVPGASGVYSFDPLGRDIPLFSGSSREGYGESWVSPEEWQLPGPIDHRLFGLAKTRFYPEALALFEGDTAPYSLIDASRATIDVERGRFCFEQAPAHIHGSYHYGFTSEIGAGPFDQRRGGMAALQLPLPVAEANGGGPLAVPGLGTLSLADSLTYGLPAAPAAPISAAALVGRNGQRPVIREATGGRGQLRLEGGPDATLVLQGIHFAGADLVLSGEFDSVHLRYMTLDPGTSGAGLAVPSRFAAAIDGHTLWPTRLFVEGRIGELVIERCITGPIRTRGNGRIERLTISDSIVQAVPESTGGLLDAAALIDLDGLVRRILKSQDPLSTFVRSELDAATLAAMSGHAGGAAEPALVSGLLDGLNGLLKESSGRLYDPARFARARLPAALEAGASQPRNGDALVAFNRKLLESAFLVELADLALGTTSGTTELRRTTVLGAVAVHRLNASETILDDRTTVADSQHGCVRFSAYAEGSTVHQPYESVSVPVRSGLFASRDFGRPDFARLRTSADESIVAGRAGASIAQGAQNGSEMGAFAAELLPLRRRGLLQKFAEFMPIGLDPVVIDAT